MPTASNISALSHLHQDGRSGAATQVSRAATWLLARKQSDGSFTDHAADTGSERSTASAYLAFPRSHAPRWNAGLDRAAVIITTHLTQHRR